MTDRAVFDTVNMGDTGVIERSEDLRFPLKAGHSIRARERFR
jgi:hypothetical protein